MNLDANNIKRIMANYDLFIKLSEHGEDIMEFLAYDLFQYLIYLASSDGKITSSESKYINDVFDQRFSPKEYSDIALKFGLDSEEFANKVPISIIKAAGFEREDIKQGRDPDPVAANLGLLFQYCGEDILSADKTESPPKKAAYDSYMAKINACIKAIKE